MDSIEADLATAATRVAAGGWWALYHLVRSGTPAPRLFLYPERLDTPLLPWLRWRPRWRPGRGLFGQFPGRRRPGDR